MATGTICLTADDLDLACTRYPTEEANSMRKLNMGWMLGLALAFGLGGRELARKYLERRFGREEPETREREKEDQLSPL